MRVLFMNSASIDRIGGNLVQLFLEINMWNKFDNQVYFLSYMKPTSYFLPYAVEKDVKLIFPNYKNNDYRRLKLYDENYVSMAVELDKKEMFDYIICRGALLNKKFLEDAPVVFKKKVICYILDDKNIEVEELREIYSNAKYIRCQHKNFIKKFSFVDRNKLLIQPPIVENNNKTIKDKSYDFVYAGSIEKLWNVDLFLDYVKKNPHVKAAIAYTKIVGYEGKKLKELEEILAKTKNLDVFSSLTNEETKNLFEKSKISFCYRSEEIDNDQSVEISTKLLECYELGCLPIVRNSKIHRDILSNNMDLCCDNDAELYEKITNLIKKYDELIHDETLHSYYPENVYKQIMDQLRRIDG